MRERNSPRRAGLWIVGVYGAVASAVIAGAKALSRQLIAPTGVVTELPEFRPVKFLPLKNLVFGGWDVRRGSVRQSFTELANVAHIDPSLVAQLGKELAKVETNIAIGTTIGCGSGACELGEQSNRVDTLPLEKMVDKFIKDITTFKSQHHLKTVIVLNLASTEPSLPPDTPQQSLKSFQADLRANRKDRVRASSLYAYAAFMAGCPYINFTPSTGASLPALQQLAREKGLPYCGRDGKTGETLIKSVLSLAFKYRALKVLSWQGYNILGNLDGKVLTDPGSKQSKVATKEAVLPSILGYQPHTHVGIDYVPSLDDWKVAWDFIHFAGFFDTQMFLQFTWQGCDSLLAAPLVLDLVRLTELAHRQGEAGALAHTALFFKQPEGTKIADLPGQWQLLNNYLLHPGKK